MMKKLLALTVAAVAAVAALPALAASPPAPATAIAAMVIDKQDVPNVGAERPDRHAIAAFKVAPLAASSASSDAPMWTSNVAGALVASADRYSAPPEVARAARVKV